MPPLEIPATPTIYEFWKAYLPPEHWKMIKFTGEVIVVEDNLAMLMHGIQSLLVASVQYFYTIPGRHNVFGGELTDPYVCNIPVFKSLKNKEFIFKQDAYTYLFYYLNCKNIKPEVVPLLAYFLKTKEIVLNGRHELILYEKEKFEECENFLLKEANSPVTNQVKFKKVNLTLLIEKLKEILPRNDKDPELKCIRKFVKNYIQSRSLKKQTLFCTEFIATASFVVTHVGKFIDEHPEWFKPGTQDKEGPAIVRLFKEVENGERKFVLAYELLIEMRRAKLDISGFEEKMRGMAALDIWNFNDVVDKIRPQFGQIEFIVTPLPSTRFRASYIPIILEGGFMFRTIDAINELLIDLISAKKVFQNLDQFDADRICEILNAAGFFVIQQLKNPKFITRLQAAEIMYNLGRCLVETVPEAFSANKLELSQTYQDGFNAEDFKMEIKRFGIEKAFPRVTFNMTQMAYNDIAAFQQSTVLKGGDLLLRVLETIQLNCVYIHTHNIAKILHESEGCKAVGIICPFCVELKQKSEEEKPSEEPDDDIVVVFEKLLRNDGSSTSRI